MRVSGGATIKVLDSQGNIVYTPGLRNGTLTVGTTPTQLTTTTIPVRSVILKADDANTADILLGDATTQTFPLSKGMAIGLDMVALNMIYTVSTASGQKLYWIAGGL